MITKRRVSATFIVHRHHVIEKTACTKIKCVRRATDVWNRWSASRSWRQSWERRETSSRVLALCYRRGAIDLISTTPLGYGSTYLTSLHINERTVSKPSHNKHWKTYCYYYRPSNVDRITHHHSLNSQRDLQSMLCEYGALCSKNR